MKHRFPAIYFEATRLCNLSCPICMTSSNDEQCVRNSRGRELTFQEIRDLVLVPAKRLGTVAVGPTTPSRCSRSAASSGSIATT